MTNTCDFFLANFCYNLHEHILNKILFQKKKKESLHGRAGNPALSRLPVTHESVARSAEVLRGLRCLLNNQKTPIKPCFDTKCVVYHHRV